LQPPAAIHALAAATQGLQLTPEQSQVKSTVPLLPQSTSTEAFNPSADFTILISGSEIFLRVGILNAKVIVTKHKA
jgi:hypothetical protein